MLLVRRNTLGWSHSTGEGEGEGEGGGAHWYVDRNTPEAIASVVPSCSRPQ